MAKRIAKLVALGLTGQDLTLSWFTRWIQPLQYHDRLMCRYVDKHDKLRVTDNDLTADALNKRIRTIYKVGRDITVHKIGRDIYTKGEVPPVSSSSVRISFQFRLASFLTLLVFSLIRSNVTISSS